MVYTKDSVRTRHIVVHRARVGFPENLRKGEIAQRPLLTFNLKVFFHCAAQEEFMMGAGPCARCLKAKRSAANICVGFNSSCTNLPNDSGNVTKCSEL